VAREALSKCGDLDKLGFDSQHGWALAVSNDEEIVVGVKPLIGGDPQKFSIVLATKGVDPFVVCLREWMGYNRAKKVAGKLNTYGGSFASYVLGFPVFCMRTFPNLNLPEHKFALNCKSLSQYGLTSPQGACERVLGDAAESLCVEAY